MSNDQPDTARSAIIRSLNDRFRQTFTGGAVVITAGIVALDEATRQRIFAAVQAFDAFDEDNDPSWRSQAPLGRAEHDFGAVEIDVCLPGSARTRERVFFKLAYYDLTRAMHSEDAADPAKTERVMTIMLSDEY